VSDKSDFLTQPPPLPGGPDAVSSHDLVIGDLVRQFGQHHAGAAVSAMLVRRQFGFNKYGEVLHKDNGRNHPLDALEEIQDLAVYLRTGMDADPSFREAVEENYPDVLRLLIKLQDIVDFKAYPE
jgi:hypothetical protein